MWTYSGTLFYPTEMQEKVHQRRPHIRTGKHYDEWADYLPNFYVNAVTGGCYS